MAKIITPLSANQVKNAKPRDKLYKLSDGGVGFVGLSDGQAELEAVVCAGWKATDNFAGAVS